MTIRRSVEAAPLRIALVSEHANPLASIGGVDAGGQNVHVAALARGLARRGHQVVVHTRRDDLTTPTRVACEDGYVVDHVPAGPPTEVPKDELLPHMAEMADQLAQRWSDEPVDVVHAHFWMSGLATLRASADTGIPVVQTFHALGSVKRREQRAADTSPPGRVDLERTLCRRVDHVVATCRDEVRELRALGLDPRRATVIPCGVDTDRFRPAPVRRPRIGGLPHRVLVVGRLVARKGVDDVIRAIADPAHGLGDVELLVAGGPPGDLLDADPEVGRLREVAERLGASDRVRFLGSVPRAEVPRLIQAADVVVTAPWYEPFGIVPLEAMACGKPVVGTAVGGLLDTVVPGVTGELVAPRDPVGLAAAVRGLLADPARRAAYGEAGRRRAVELYDWRRVVQQTEAVYAAVAAGHAAPARATEVGS